MYSHVFLGGTFDRLHKGHEAVIGGAFAAGDRVTIGLTSDFFIQKFRSDTRIRPFADRKQTLERWLAAHDFQNRSEIIAIDDPYEPAASMDGLDAIIVTSDNRTRGEEINRRRAAKGLPELVLVDVPLASAQDREPISATRVRSGEIDAAGRLIMPDNLRPELAKPLGRVLTGDAVGQSIEQHRDSVIIAVGDMTTQTLLTTGVIPNLIIVDFRVDRKPFPDIREKLAALGEFQKTVRSGPGFVAVEAAETIKKWRNHPAEKMILAIDGEEDLLAIPAIVYAPEGAVVYYGQPGQGLVEVEVLPDKQQKAELLLRQFLPA